MFNIGTVQIPLNGAIRSYGILGKRGSGKTYGGAVFAEELHKAGIPFVVFDPINVWWGMKLAANGKGPGLPIVVFGKVNADIPLEKDMGAEIAQAFVRDNISCVISTKGMPKTHMRQIIADFSEELLNINNSPRMTIIEEAHEFVPQRVMGAGARTFAAVESLVTMGRNTSLGVIMLNQRAATINKDVLTQIDTLIALRQFSPQDRKALTDWVDFHDVEGEKEEFAKSLASLETGSGWLVSPEFLGKFERMKFRKRETFHPDPEKPVDFKMSQANQTDVQEFISRFSAQIKDKKSKEHATDSSKSKSTKVTSKRPIERLSVDFPLSQDANTLIERATRDLRNDYESKLMVKDTQIGQLMAVIENVRRAVVITDGSAVPTQPTHSDYIGGETNLVLEKLGGMPKNLYSRLLQHPGGLTKRQLALMCGYALSGSYRNAISKLKTMGLIKVEGETLRALTR